MNKFKTCEQCDAEFKIKQPEGNEELFGKPLYCPFCATELDFKKNTNDFYEDDELEHDE